MEATRLTKLSQKGTPPCSGTENHQEPHIWNLQLFCSGELFIGSQPRDRPPLYIKCCLPHKV